MWCILTVILLISNCFAVDEVPNRNYSNDDSADDNEVEPESTTISVLQAWLNTEKKTQENIEELVRKMLPMLIRGSAEVNVSAPCQASILKLVFALRQNKPWAYRMGDAWGKVPGGMLTGTIAAFGSYDECTEIEVIENDKLKFQGKYCIYDFYPLVPPKPRFYSHKSIVPELKNLTMSGSVQGENAKLAHYFYFLPMRFGVCFPSTCTDNDILNICSQLPKHAEVSGKSKVPRCEIKEPKKIAPGQAVYLAFVGLLALVVTIGTALDIILKRKTENEVESPSTNKIVKVLVCFSIYTNFPKLTNTRQAPDSLPVLHGFRFITITWVIVCHSYLYLNYGLLRYSSIAAFYSRDLLFQAILNSAPAVDSFFFMSGLLTMYVMLKNMEKGSTGLNIQLYVFHRLWRLCPPYYFTVATMFILPLLANGPVWFVTLDPMIEECRKNWWTNLIFLNNFINTEKMCIEPSWYMAVDMQLHILALAVLIPFLKWRSVAMLSGLFIVAAATITAGVINFYHDLPPTPLAGNPDPDDRDVVCSTQYFKPYIHVAPYMIGLVTGYLIVKKATMQIKPVIQFILWTVSVALALLILYCALPWNSGDGYSRSVAAAYAALSKLVWGLCMAWLIFACVTGRGGFINTFLSWKGWIPFSRLSFTLYLTHPIVQWLYMAFQHERIYPSHFAAVYLIFGHFMVSLGLALILTLVLESPFMSLEKIIFNRPGRTSEETFQERNDSKIPEFGAELKPRFIPKETNGNATITNFTRNGGIDNKAFSSHL